ncbi:MAG: hypothetical protein CVU77_03290 [Elusimicrobia bacterium HGW-Elusimicrobia-1]|jgi:hypothetical protein|nr:MAG: hypothetical protein CVU77_03290 [Elusimicrobia bacterium HGW-Elusimicrobia-1]
MLKKAIVVILLAGLTCALHSEPVGKTNQDVGKIAEPILDNILNAQGMTKVLWKGRYDKTEEDVLITVVITKRKNKNLVTGLWFQ